MQQVAITTANEQPDMQDSTQEQKTRNQLTTSTTRRNTYVKHRHDRLLYWSFKFTTCAINFET